LKSKKRKKTHAMACLSAIEGYLGGRDILAERLGVVVGTVNNWHFAGSFPEKYALTLSKLSKKRFTTEELICRWGDE